MSGFSVQPNRYKKVTGISMNEDLEQPDRILRAILKVDRENYIPDSVDLRERIDGMMFTAEFPASKLQSLESDEHVESVAVSKYLDIIE